MNSKISKSFTKQLHYPLFLNISGRSCIVIGGGRVAERKVSQLLQFNAAIKVISPKITVKLSKFSEAGRIKVLKREYEEGDLKDALLVFAATNRKIINEKIKKEAEKKGISVNVVDDPELCDFIVPSIIKKDMIIIAISTSGTLPSFSKRLKKEINEYINSDYVEYVNLVGRFRAFLIENVKDRKKRSEIMREINKTDMKELLQMNMKKIKAKYLNINK